MTKRILVGVDGSDGSRRAAEFARNLANACAAGFTVFHAVEPAAEAMAQAFGLPVSDLRRWQLDEAQRMLDDVCRDLDIGTAEKVLEVGPAAESLCAAADDHQADMIVVGAQGHGPYRQMPGSIAARLAVMAHRTIAIVR